MHSVAKRALGIGAGVALSLTALTVGSAQAAVPITTTADDVGFIQTATVEDDGGVAYTISVDWNYKYKDPAGATRVSLNPLKITRSDSELVDAGLAEDSGLDVHFDVSSHGTVRWTQHKLIDNADMDYGVDNQWSYNPRNPISDASDTFIRVRVGTDGDGLGSSDFVYFYQPEGIGPKPAA
jgi:hypothetical protein